MAIDLRIFIVGCPRSGTTLLQKHLAAHQDIYSFPETHLFTRPPQHPLLRLLGLHSRSKMRAYKAFLNAIHIGYRDLPLPWYARLRGMSDRYFVCMLDEFAAQAGKRIWLEKTPDHLYTVENISKSAMPCKFIHIVRNGRDVAASLFEVSTKYPEVWCGPYSVQKCVGKWNDALLETKKWAGHQDHYIVRYENFVKRPSEYLEEICQFLGIKFEESLLNPDASLSASLVTSEEAWKQQSLSENIIPDNLSKFDQVFTEQQRQMVASTVLDIDTVLGC